MLTLDPTRNRISSLGEEARYFISFEWNFSRQQAFFHRLREDEGELRFEINQMKDPLTGFLIQIVVRVLKGKLTLQKVYITRSPVTSRLPYYPEDSAEFQGRDATRLISTLSYRQLLFRIPAYAHDWKPPGWFFWQIVGRVFPANRPAALHLEFDKEGELKAIAHRSHVRLFSR